MRWLLFLSRVALICNICYLLTVLGRYFKLQSIPQFIVSTIVVLAIFGIILNLFVTIVWLLNVLKNKRTVPFVLAFVNFLFLIFELVNSSLAML